MQDNKHINEQIINQKFHGAFVGKPDGATKWFKAHAKNGDLYFAIAEISKLEPPKPGVPITPMSSNYVGLVRIELAPDGNYREKLYANFPSNMRFEGALLDPEKLVAGKTEIDLARERKQNVSVEPRTPSELLAPRADAFPVTEAEIPQDLVEVAPGRFMREEHARVVSKLKL